MRLPIDNVIYKFMFCDLLTYLLTLFKVIAVNLAPLVSFRVDAD